MYIFQKAQFYYGRIKGIKYVDRTPLDLIGSELYFYVNKDDMYHYYLFSTAQHL